jgi:uncharacterized Fe-S cluster-containing radical SAM superfamily protein
VTNKYAHSDLAPYWRFRPSWFYSDEFPNGTYSGDIMGCNWTCEGCWSKYGWRTVNPKMELDPAQVATKFIEGMKRNVQTMGRLTGGEPGMYWKNHVHPMIDEFLERSKGTRMKVPGLTGLRGDPIGLVIETNGTLQGFDEWDKIESDWGEEAERILIAIGIKSTTPEGLADLTGLSPSVAERAHEKQLANIMHILHKCEHLNVRAVFLDSHTDMGMYSALAREVERAKPGRGRAIEVVPYKNFGNASRYYTPKRMRENVYPDRFPEQDEELILGLVDKDGNKKDDFEGEEFEGEELETMKEHAAQIAAQNLPEGRFNEE